MNVDLLVMVIILYIIKNNSRQYWYAKNKNQNLLLLLLFINERNQCLNNKYYMSYPNHPLENSNCIKNTSNDTFINNSQANIINNDKGAAMSKNNTPIDTNKNITKNTNKNTIVNKNKSTSNNKNSNGAILKNKFIKATTKTYNKPNNSRRYWYNKSSNQNLLLLLLFINERYYKNYPTPPLENSNCIKNTSKDTSIDTNKNTNKNTTVNKNNDTIIDTNKDITKNTSKASSTNNIEDDIINSDKSDTISKNTDCPIDTNKNSNDDDTTINNNKNINKNTKKNNIVNKDNSISNDKNSNQAILENKFIKAATKVNNKPLTYKNPYKRDYKININNTFKQLPLAKEIIDINKSTNHFNIKTPTPLKDVKGKVPVLVGSTNITEVFHGRIIFFKPIISILKVTNEIFITSKSILPTLHSNNNNNNNTVLHYEGFLKTRLEYLEDVIIEHSQIKCDSKHYIMFIPFSGSKDLKLTDESINSSNIVLQDFTLDINKSTFSVDTCLEKPSKGNKYINLYKICNLTVKVDCDVSLYRKKLVQL